VVIVDVAPAPDWAARPLRGLPAPIVILTSSADRAQFGPRVNDYRFVAKADISATVLAALASAPERAGPDPGNLTPRGLQHLRLTGLELAK